MLKNMVILNLINNVLMLKIINFKILMVLLMNMLMQIIQMMWIILYAIFNYEFICLNKIYSF